MAHPVSKFSWLPTLLESQAPAFLSVLLSGSAWQKLEQGLGGGWAELDWGSIHIGPGLLGTENKNRGWGVWGRAPSSKWGKESSPGHMAGTGSLRTPFSHGLGSSELRDWETRRGGGGLGARGLRADGVTTGERVLEWVPHPHPTLFLVEIVGTF